MGDESEQLSFSKNIDALITVWRDQHPKWRTEPEISHERKRRLIALLDTISPDDTDSPPPLILEKLTRADVEWLITNSYAQRVILLERMKQIIDDPHSIGRIDLETIRDLRRKMNATVFRSRFIDLRAVILTNVDLRNIPLDSVLLDNADLTGADLRDTALYRIQLAGAVLDRAKIQNVSLAEANLRGASLAGTFLEGADLRGCHLEGAKLINTHLAGAVLDGAFLDYTTKLAGLYITDASSGSVIFGDIYWNGADLSNIKWSQLTILGDEAWADRMKQRRREMLHKYPTKKKEYTKQWREPAVVPYKRAARTNHKLAKVLQDQDLSDDARRFAYRSNVLRRKVLLMERNIPGYIGSLFLDFLSGYGYQPGKSFLTYLLVIGFFMAIYHLAGHNLGWMESFVISMSAFHGRGFFPGTFSPGDPLSIAGAFEALIGLIIEVTFIATLSQRLFRK